MSEVGTTTTTTHARLRVLSLGQAKKRQHAMITSPPFTRLTFLLPLHASCTHFLKTSFARAQFGLSWPRAARRYGHIKKEEVLCRALFAPPHSKKSACA